MEGRLSSNCCCVDVGEVEEAMVEVLSLGGVGEGGSVPRNPMPSELS